MEPSPNRPVLVLIGPSGAGKSSLARALQRQGIVRIVPTWTTRPRRADETVDCPEHHFVDDGEFDRRLTAGYFRATGQLPGLPYRYGLPFAAGPDVRIPLVIGRAAFVPALSGGHPALVYQLHADPETLRRRFTARGLPAAEVALRLAAVEAEARAGAGISRRRFDATRSPDRVLADVRAALAADGRPLPARSRQSGAPR